MTHIEFMSGKSLLAIGAALGYALTTVLMKMTAEGGGAVIIFALGTVLLVSIGMEIALLKRVELGIAYLAIIATETMLVLSYSFAIGEGLNMREMLGGAFVLAGIVLVSF